MKKYLTSCPVLFFILFAPSYADLVSDTSNTFSFPVQVKSNFEKINGRVSHLSYRQPSLHSASVRILWELPGEINKNSRIEVYTLSGKLLNIFNIDSRKGCVDWDCSRQVLSSQILVMRLKNGSYSKRVKMLLL